MAAHLAKVARMAAFFKGWTFDYIRSLTLREFKAAHDEMMRGQRNGRE